MRRIFNGQYDRKTQAGIYFLLLSIIGVSGFISNQLLYRLLGHKRAPEEDAKIAGLQIAILLSLIAAYHLILNPLYHKAVDCYSGHFAVNRDLGRPHQLSKRLLGYDEGELGNRYTPTG